jgi:myo-inositol-1(or 4)-monophosphatase
MKHLEAELLDAMDIGLWCLDPLDGTTNFVAGIPFYCVSLALFAAGEVVLGLVYDPDRDECFTAHKERGVWLNGGRLGRVRPPTPPKDGVALVDLKRLPAELAGRLLREPPYASQRSFGSVALAWCWLAAGRGHVFLSGRQSLWDYAAGALILREAGGHAAAFDGEPLFRPTLKPRTVAAALDPDLFRQWAAWLRVPADPEGPG